MKMMASLGAVLIAAMVGWAGIAKRASAETHAVVGAGTKVSAMANPQSAAGLYTTYCAKCHGADGKAQTPQGKETGAKDFTSARWKSRTSVEEAAATIRDGYQDMPSYKKRMTAAQIQSLAQYVKSFPH